MAKNAAVWGIDIGRCALKTLRCRLDGDAVVADGFDYIEYPKLLTQPDAEAAQLVKEALEQFLSRNSVKGDKVAITVSGESGLARYFKPPPVDVKKIADIVKYEAKQQIPFALEDVIWDYQRMAGGQEIDGFALDTEIGLFAMKREQVTKALAPYNTANIEVDVIQLAPIAIYNYIGYDVAKEIPAGEEYNSDSPPPSMVVLSIGTDTTDLVVTNGYRVWQRNIPLGGNHFTKQLSKDLKLTFAKAEHLKRNPKQAEDPKAVFQAMRPVFADMVTEVQRSIGFFQSLDRKAKIDSVMVLGNTVKLPGLVQYLSKHLGYEVKEIDSFNKLTGASVVTSPSFRDNLLAFGACYGLCLQGLGKSKLSTNLLPREILTHRMIRAKKPWAVAGVGALVLACAFNYIFYSSRLNQVHPDMKVKDVTWSAAVDEAKKVGTYSGGLISADKTKQDQVALLQKIGQEVVGASDRRVLWLEVMKAINVGLPPMVDGQDPARANIIPDVKQLPFIKRKDLKIEYVESQFFPDLTLWFNDSVKTKWLQLNPDAAAAPASTDPSAPPPTPAPAPVAPVATAPATPGMETGGATVTAPTTDVSAITVAGPTGQGWVIEIKGHHFFNDPTDRRNAGPAHVIKTIIHHLEKGTIDLPLGPGLPNATFTMKDLGISHVILAEDLPIRSNFPIQNPHYSPPASGAGAGTFGTTTTTDPALAAAEKARLDPTSPDYNPEYFFVPRYDFKIQFCWVEKPMTVRLAEMEKKAEEARKAAEAAAAAGQVAPVPGVPPAPAAPVPAPGDAPVPAPGVTVPAPGDAPVPAPGITVPAPGVAPVPAPGVTVPAPGVAPVPAPGAAPIPPPEAPGNAPATPVPAPATPVPVTPMPAGAAPPTPAAPAPGVPAAPVPGVPALPPIPEGPM